MEPSPERNLARLLPAVAAAALLGTVAVAGVLGAVGGGQGGDAAGDVVTGTLPTPGASGGSTTTSSLATTTTRPRTTLSAALGPGMSGEEVRRLQTRLDELGFVPGPIDGDYGSLTEAAVWAYEKLVAGVARSEVSGVVTPEMWLALQDPLPVEARRLDAGKHTEIYLPEQVLVVFDGPTPVFISHISTGDNEEWIEDVTISPGEYGNEDGTEPLVRPEQGLSETPGGVFEYYRRVVGRRQSALGGMLNPVYFNYGIAVHGAYEVPKEPASHGCIRIPNAVSEYFQTLVTEGEAVFVWDGVEEPETYGAQVPPFNTVLPTTSTSTTAPPTTVPPTTEAPTSPPTPAPPPPAPAPPPPPPPPTTTPPTTTPPTTTPPTTTPPTTTPPTTTAPPTMVGPSTTTVAAS